MVIQNWKTKTSRIVYRRFQPGESLMEVLESLARSEGIREAIITSCIGSLSQLKLRNLRIYEDGVQEFQRQVIDENFELVSAEGYIQPLPQGDIRGHIHVAAPNAASVTVEPMWVRRRH